jgi:hypothetical protein
MRGRSFALLVAGLSCVGLRDVGAQNGRNINVSLRAYDHAVKLDTIASWSDVIGTPAVTFAAIRRIVDSLKIPISVADSAHGLLFNRGFKARSKLAGRPMLWTFRCGLGMTGDYAETARIDIAYAVFVDAAADGNARVGIAFVGSGDVVDGAYKPPMQCNTTGQLELEILKLAQLRALKR